MTTLPLISDLLTSALITDLGASLSVIVIVPILFVVGIVIGITLLAR